MPERTVTLRHVDILTLIFSGIAAVGAVMAVCVASGPQMRLVESKHRKLDKVTDSYREMFGRAYRFVMDDLDGTGHVKPENAKTFGRLADGVMYRHAADEAEAWERHRDIHGL